jgi:predicted ABC-type transport system involved in lysophospholipase L1 biosynthesis ATPase subunit
MLAIIFGFNIGMSHWHMTALLVLCGALVGPLVLMPVVMEVRSIVSRFSARRPQLKSRATGVLTSFGLGHRLKHRPRELSGGERQRVAIARALMNNPDVLLADEPTGNLDEETGREILDLIAEQHGKGLTIVMVTHDINVAARADRIVKLHHGRVET